MRKKTYRRQVGYSYVLIIVCIFVIVFGVIFLSSVPASAQDITLETQVKKLYLGPDGSRWYDKPVVQSEILFAWENGLYLNFMGDSAFNKKRDWDKEVNLFLGYNANWKKIGLELEAGYCFTIEEDLFLSSIELNSDTPISLFINWDHYSPIENGELQGGDIFGVGTRTGFPLGKYSEFNIEGGVRYGEAFGYERAWVGFGEANLSLIFGRRFVVSGGITYSKPITIVNDGRKEEWVWNGGFSLKLR